MCFIYGRCFGISSALYGLDSLFHSGRGDLESFWLNRHQFFVGDVRKRCMYYILDHPSCHTFPVAVPHTSSIPLYHCFFQCSKITLVLLWLCGFTGIKHLHRLQLAFINSIPIWWVRCMDYWLNSRQVCMFKYACKLMCSYPLRSLDVLNRILPLHFSNFALKEKRNPAGLCVHRPQLFGNGFRDHTHMHAMPQLIDHTHFYCT